MKANKFNQGGIESFLQPTTSSSIENNTTSAQKPKKSITPSEKAASVVKSGDSKTDADKKAPALDADKIMKDYLPYLTRKKAKQTKSNRVSYLLTDKAMYTLEAIESTTGFKKNAIINAVLEKEADKYGYKE